MARDTPPRVVFLGNNYNPISLACLQTLADSGDSDVWVGIHDSAAGSFLKLIRKSVKNYGVVFCIRRAGDLIVSRLRLLAAAFGIRLPGARSLREMAAAYRLRVFECGRINSPERIREIQAIHPDVIAVAAFSQVLKFTLIGIPRYGCINVHPSLLPRYRGPNPFYWVLKNREAVTGVTVHFIDDGIDSGDIILQEEIPILRDDSEQSLRERSATVSARLLLKGVDALIRGDVSRQRQNQREASYYPLPPRGASRL